MSVIFLLIPLSIVIAACFLGAFIWAVRAGQYEDTFTPAMRVLLEDAGVAPAGETSEQGHSSRHFSNVSGGNVAAAEDSRAPNEQGTPRRGIPTTVRTLGNHWVCWEISEP